MDSRPSEHVANKPVYLMSNVNNRGKLKLISEKTDLLKKGRHLFLYMLPKAEIF